MTIFSPEYRRLLGFLKPYKSKFSIALLAMVVYGATDGILPILIKRILDDIFGAKNEAMLYALPVYILIFALVRGSMGFVQQYLSGVIGFSIIRDIRNAIQSHLLTLSPAFYAREQSGSLISRVTNDTLQVKTAITDALSSILRDSVRVLALLAAAIYLDPVLALIALIGFPLGFYPLIRFGKRIRKLSKSGQDQFGGLTSLLQETVLGHGVVQANNQEAYEAKRFAAENANLTKTLIKAEKYGALSAPTNELIASVAIGLVLLYGGYSVLQGVRTQGDFVAFLSAMFMLYEPFKKLSRINYMLQTGSAAAERIFSVLDTKSEIDDRQNAQALNLNSDFSIKFNQVCFKYQSKDEYALDHLNFTLQRGQTLALVGPSGGGKSTIGNLLLRFYDPLKGSIEIAGKDLRDLKLASLRAQIGFVGQHTFLFNDTVFNNIAYGNLQASVAEVEAAARAAHAEEFILNLPQQYQTVIGEFGMSLSGGQRQRLAIARALLKNSPILLLDEATAALDSESERLVQEALDQLVVGRTVIVIAHRLSTIRRADQILVIQQGKVVESGTHQDLLKQSGVYQYLYNLQFAEGSAEHQQGEPRSRFTQ